MTLLDKLTYIIKPGLAGLLIPVFFACQDPTELGLEVEGQDQNTGTKYAEFVLPASSIYIDSLRTDHYSNVIFGRFEDNIYGETSATAYIRYNLDDALPADTLAFESATLVMWPDDYKFASGDILLGEEIAIHEATDTLYSEAVYLSGNKTEYEPDPIASHSFDFNPNEDSVLTFALSDEFGLTLYNQLKRAKEDTASLDSLTKGLFPQPPLVLVPGALNQGLFSFNLNEDTVGVYINMVDPSGNRYHCQFDLRDVHYAYLTRDRSSSTVLSSLNVSYEDSVAGPTSYISMTSGIYTKLNLQPYLDFVEEQENFIIQSAELSLETDPASGGLPPISNLSFYFIKENGKINGPGTLVPSSRVLNAILTEGSYSGEDPVLLSVPYDDDEGNYSGNVTLFTQILADNHRTENDYLARELVVLNTRITGIRQTTLSTSEIKLKVYYTVLK